MVYQIVSYLANGDTVDAILAAYPQLSKDDVQACLAFAAEMTRDRFFPIKISS